MKTLQNNYTTPEQSKRLWELGLPADSADMCYCPVEEDWGKPQLRNGDEQIGYTYPCWSVGRLIEIWNICNDSTATFVSVYPYSIVENLVQRFENCKEVLNFSKLED